MFIINKCSSVLLLRSSALCLPILTGFCLVMTALFYSFMVTTRFLLLYHNIVLDYNYLYVFAGRQVKELSVLVRRGEGSLVELNCV